MKRLLSILAAILWSSLALAQVVGSGITGDAKVSGGGGGFAFTATDAKTAAGGFAASLTFSGVNFGTAAASRLILVAIFQNCGGCGATTGLTINGVTATLVKGDGSNNQNSIWGACSASGTSGNVVITGVSANYAITVAQIVGQSGGCSTTPTSTAFYNAAGAQPLPLAVTVNAGGVAYLMAAVVGGTAGAATSTWVNTAAAGGDENTNGGTATPVQAASSHATASASTTVTASPNSLSFGGQVISASFGP